MANLSFGGGGSASYLHYARQGQVFTSYHTITSMSAYTATAVVGPLLWNGSALTSAKQRVMVVPLSLGIGVTTASAAAVAVGLTGASGQAAAPTSTTAVTAQAPTYIGGAASIATPYNAGTVGTAGTFLLPTHSIGTGAVALASGTLQWADIGGSIVVPAGSWVGVQASATATTSVLQIGLVWAEIPY